MAARYIFDLKELSELSIDKIDDEIKNNFGDININTYEKSNLFFSHRKSSHENFPKEAKTGRHISVIGLVD